MKKILVPIGCRSDEGLSAPVIKRLKQHFDVSTIQLVPQDFGESYRLMHDSLYWKPQDLVFITGDRVEMCAAAAAAFHSKTKIAHFYAGIVNDPITTFDDVDRHCITLWSDIQFCESEISAHNTAFLKRKYISDCWDHAEEFKECDIHIVGISHLDDLEIDESKVPVVPGYEHPLTIVKPYDLILINFEPLQKKINWVWGDRNVDEIHIGSNPDARIGDIFGAATYYDNLPRPQFLGLLKNCQRFITNSSAAIYEAPYFLKPEQIIMVGERNRNRPRGPFKTGASDRIVEILKEYLK